jgi:cell division ATPase FtsA
MPFFQKKSSLILILDVQSTIVRGTLCVLTKNDRPRIIFSYEIPIDQSPHLRSGHLIQKTTKAIASVIHESLHFLQGLKIDQIHYVLSAPWIISRSRTISTEFKKQSKIKTAHIMNMIALERNELYGRTDAELTIVEEKIFDVRLDGTSRSAWHNTKAQHLNVSYVVSMAHADTISKFREACAFATAESNIFFHSSLLLQHIAVQQTNPRLKTYTIVHVHGGLTDVIQVRNGICSLFGSYPYGIAQIIKDISTDLNIKEQSAESYLSLYEQGSLDATHAHKTHSVIQKAQHIWAAEFVSIVGRSPFTQDRDPHILLSAHAHDVFFMNALKSIPNNTQVHRLELDDVRPRVVLDTNVRASRMTGLFAIAIHSITQ